MNFKLRGPLVSALITAVMFLPLTSRAASMEELMNAYKSGTGEDQPSSHPSPSTTLPAPSPAINSQPPTGMPVSTTPVQASPAQALPPQLLNNQSPDVVKLPVETTKPKDLSKGRFGMDYFNPARNRILNLEGRISKGQTSVPTLGDQAAISNFIGPLEMLTTSTIANVPQRYVLSPGDRLTVTYWSLAQDLQQAPVIVDDNGDVGLPRVGKLNARDMSLEQFQNAVKDLLRHYLSKDTNVVVSLDRLKSIQVYFTGEVFRPGSYAVNSASTLFNGLYLVGGPSDGGSLRKIKLMRGQKTYPIDLYDYLLHGDSSNDISLQAGDVIFIDQKQNEVVVAGEVKRPGIYELRKEETLKSLLDLSGEIKSSAYLEKIHITTMNANEEKKTVDVSIDKKGAFKDYPLFDGDVVTVSKINLDLEKYVRLSGAVDVPGDFEWKKGMRVSDLFSKINKPLHDVYFDRADIIRTNEDKRTTTLVTFNLGKALAKDQAEDKVLVRMDEVRVYSKWDVQYMWDGIVRISGPLQKPGEFKYSDGMRLSDLVTMAGGPLPDIYSERMDIIRMNEDKKTTKIITVNLGKVLAKDPEDDILLSKLDSVVTYSKWDVQFIPETTVQIFGAVQKPGPQVRSNGMRLSDAIVRAGGTLPNYLNVVEVSRAGANGEIQVIKIDIDGFLKRDMPAKSGEKEGSDSEDDPKNILLKDLDLIVVKARTEFFNKPQFVTVGGEVKYPGVYSLRSRNERLSDIIKRAGGFTLEAYPKGSVYTRVNTNLNPEQSDDLMRVNKMFKVMNDADFKRQNAINQYLMASEQANSAYNAGLASGAVGGPPPSPVSSSAVTPKQSIIMGAAAPVLTTATSTTNAAVNEGLGAGLDKMPSTISPARQLDDEGLKPGKRLILDVPGAIASPKSLKDPIIMDGDAIQVPRNPGVIRVVGAVVTASVIAYDPNLKPDKYILASGGYAEDANEDKVVVSRMDGSIIPYKDVKRLEPGDAVYVPAKVMGTEIVGRVDKIINAVKFGISAIVSAVVFVLLIARI